MLTLWMSDLGADFELGPRLLDMPDITLDRLLELLLEAPLSGTET